MLGNALLLALRQIFRNPMRSILTVLGIVIGVAAVITMVTVGNGATQQVRDQIASLGSDSLMIRPGQRLGPGQSVGAPSFKESDAEALATQIAGIKAVAPSRTSTQVVVANGKNWSTSVIGTTNDYFSINNLTIQEGRNFEQSELRAGSAVCVIGQTVKKELFENHDALGKLLRVKGFSCQIIGELEQKGQSGMGMDKDDVVIIPLNTFQRRISGNVRIPLITVAVEPGSDIERVKESSRLLLRERRSLSSSEMDNFDASRCRGSGQSFGRWHRHYEHHAGKCDGAHKRNRCAFGDRRDRAGSAASVPCGIHHARLLRRPARSYLGFRRFCFADALHGRAFYFQSRHQRAGILLCRVYRNYFRLLSGPQSGSARSDRGRSPRIAVLRTKRKPPAGGLTICGLVRTEFRLLQNHPSARPKEPELPAEQALQDVRPGRRK